MDIVGRRFPIKRAHREIIIFSVSIRKLLFKIIKRIKFMCSVKIFIDLSVAAFNFTVVSRSIRTN